MYQKISSFGIYVLSWHYGRNEAWILGKAFVYPSFIDDFRVDNNHKPRNVQTAPTNFHHPKNLISAGWPRHPGAVYRRQLPWDIIKPDVTFRYTRAAAIFQTTTHGAGGSCRAGVAAWLKGMLLFSLPLRGCCGTLIVDTRLRGWVLQMFRRSERESLCSCRWYRQFDVREVRCAVVHFRILGEMVRSLNRIE